MNNVFSCIETAQLLRLCGSFLLKLILPRCNVPGKTTACQVAYAIPLACIADIWKLAMTFILFCPRDYNIIQNQRLIFVGKFTLPRQHNWNILQLVVSSKHLGLVKMDRLFDLFNELITYLPFI